MKRLLALVCTCLLGIGMLPAGVAAEEPPVAMEVVFVHSKGALNNIRNNPTVCYCLEADLVFTPEDFAEGGAFYNEGRGWIPIGDRETPFSGWLQGNGHTISGLQCTASEGGDLYGLFGVSTGLIEGLTVDGFSVTGTPPASASVGTIAAENDGTIAGCAGGGSLAGPQPGGIVGSNRGEVIGCVNFGEVRLESPGSADTGSAGGIAADNTGILYGCENYGRIISANDSCLLGGIAGSNRWDASAGELSGTVMFCTNYGPVEGTGGRSYTGGICGRSDYLLIGCGNAAPVTGFWAGGIAGSHGGILSLCVNSGSVTGGGYAGGLVGCCDNESGLFPLENATVSDSYNLGEVSGITGGSIGGIVGYTERGILTRVYNVGRIRTASARFSGGITGGTQVIADCFPSCYYLQTSGEWTAEQLAMQMGIACTDEELRRAATLEGFDFQEVWYQLPDEAYPYPRLVVFAQTGDVNTDGAVNSSDARLALQKAVGSTELSAYRQLLADVNQDGMVNSSDARWILQTAVSLL